MSKEQLGFILETLAFFLVTIDLYGERGPSVFNGVIKSVFKHPMFYIVLIFSSSMVVFLPIQEDIASEYDKVLRKIIISRDQQAGADLISIMPYMYVIWLFAMALSLIIALTVARILLWIIDRYDLNGIFIWVGAAMFIVARVMTFPLGK